MSSPNQQFVDYFSNADLLLIIPPTPLSQMPNTARYGPHLLQSIAAQNGTRVKIFYANLLFYSLLTPRLQLLFKSIDDVTQEQLFSSFAFGRDFSTKDLVFLGHLRLKLQKIPHSDLLQIESKINELLEVIASVVVNNHISIVGTSSMSCNLVSSVAIVRHLKERIPSITTIIGGPSCFEDLAQGVASLNAPIDFIFMDRAEESFSDFLTGKIIADKPSNNIICAKPVSLEQNPPPDFSDFTYMLRCLFPEIHHKKLFSLSYEVGAGCEWGGKVHCTFCGMSERELETKTKNHEKIIEDLKYISDKNPLTNILLVDNMLNSPFLSQTMPRIGEIEKLGTISCSIKAATPTNTLEIMSLNRINSVQVGIESLSTNILKAMRKGTTTSQNLATLKKLCELGIDANWNFIYGVPGEKEDDYLFFLKLIPLLYHLQPPAKLQRMGLLRYSLYLNNPQVFAITDIAPSPELKVIYPPWSDISALAYTYSFSTKNILSKNHPLIEQLSHAVQLWQDSWTRAQKPKLHLSAQHGNYFLEDTRQSFSSKNIIKLTHQEYLTLKDPGSSTAKKSTVDWAIENGYCIIIDTNLISLVLAYNQDNL